MAHSMIYYVCKYADYADLPEPLFTGATAGDEQKSLDGTKFVAWSREPQATGSISWMHGNEPAYTHKQITAELQSGGWIEGEPPK